MKSFSKLLFYVVALFLASCSNGTDSLEISNAESKVTGEASAHVSILADTPTIITVEETKGEWLFKARLSLRNEKTLGFGDCRGTIARLCIVGADGEKLDAEFTPGATDKGVEKEWEKLFELLTSKSGETKEFVYHYVTDDSDEKEKLIDEIKNAKSVEIVDFDFEGNYFEIDDDGTQDGDYASENSEERDQESSDAGEMKKTFSNSDLPELKKHLETAAWAFVRNAGGLDDYHQATYGKAQKGDVESVKQVYKWLEDVYSSPGHDALKEGKSLVALAEMIVKMGDPDGYLYLGQCYVEQRGGTNDLAKGVQYLEMASKYDIGYAYYGLGWCYEHGKGVKTNRRKAADYYHEAYNLGVDEAERKWLHCFN